MSKLIQKSGYIKPGSAGRYMKYIATRDGVEIIPSQDIYMKYIATRPRAEKHGGHGLFGAASDVDLTQALSELESHDGNVWTFIFSLRREDASRLGYDNAASWRNLLMLHSAEIAGALGITRDRFHWYAAFHDEGSHPHVHMIAWSEDPKQGYLTADGIEAIRSKLTNTIFKDELQNLYVKKDVSYKELTAQAQRTMTELIQKMQSRIFINPVIEQKMQALVIALGSAKGKKQYGYLKKETKELVDSIVDELAAQPEVAECYAVWNGLRDELEAYYKDKPREHLPLSQQKEFRAVKNMVIREAENIHMGVFTFEDENMQDEPETDIQFESAESMSMEDILYEPEAQTQYLTIERLERLWEEVQGYAAHLLGKLYRDGEQVPQDREKAEHWFKLSAESGNDSSEYALGKLLLEQGSTDEALDCLNRAAEHGSIYAMYCLGKLYLIGEAVDKNIDTALQYLTASAEQGNQYAQYALGKLYMQGREVPRDIEKALCWLEKSAEQGNFYAEYLLERANEYRDPSIMLSATRLLHHMSRVFQANSAPPSNPQGICIDSKRRRQLMEKRLAMGHKIDDHEEWAQRNQQTT